MATQLKLPGLNPDVLIWARQHTGQEVEMVAQRLKKPPETLKAWEAGHDSPTYPQLEKLAEIYRRPTAVFFFPEPPDEPDLGHSFRTLPDFELADLEPDTRFKIRDGLAKQLTLGDLADRRNPAKRLIFRDVTARVTSEPAALAVQVRAYLKIGLDDQRQWPSVTAALDSWRECIESNGIFVFKDSFKQRDVSGFCLYGEEFPIIYLNNSVAKSRQIFTLFHELAHLLLGTNGVTKRDLSYISSLSGEEKRIEVFCNAFAGEFLVPKESITALLVHRPPPDEDIGRFASKLKVSREVILRRLLDLNVVSQRYYQSKASEWTADYFDHRPTLSGGNFYNTKVAYLGRGYLELAFRQFYRGAISRIELAETLGVKTNSIAGIEQRFLFS